MTKQIALITTGSSPYIVHRLDNRGISFDSTLDLLAESNKGKMPVGLVRSCLESHLKSIDRLGIKLIITNSLPYFKELTGSTSSAYGKLLPCTKESYESITVLQVPSYAQARYSEDLYKIINITIKIAASFIKGKMYDPFDILQKKIVPKSVKHAKALLSKIHAYNKCAIDIEATGLAHTSKLLSISFTYKHKQALVMSLKNQPRLLKVVKEFLAEYKGKAIYHGATFDTKLLIYNLWMDRKQHNYKGMVKGIQALSENITCTLFLMYFKFNSATGRMPLGLKPNSIAFAGEYAEDMSNPEDVPIDKMLTYNAKDTVCTFKLWNDDSKMLKKTKQDTSYKLFCKDIAVINMQELTGMCLDEKIRKKNTKKLKKLQKKQLTIIHKIPVVKKFIKYATLVLTIQKNIELKAKQVHKVPYEFNVGSGQQTANFLFTYCGYEPTQRTATGLPSTDAAAIKELRHTVSNKQVLKFIDAYLILAKVDKLISSFLPAFSNGTLNKSGNYRWLHGSIKATGTLSTRRSVVNPPMQTIPSNSDLSELIKEMFVAPSGWIFCSADYASLEDKVATLLSRDSNKMKIYLDGYDSHSFNTLAYFREKMPKIKKLLKKTGRDPKKRVRIINKIQELYPKLRQDSKGPTFAMFFLGTEHTLVKKFGFTLKEATGIYKNFHKLYEEYDNYIDSRLEEAHEKGYVKLCNGAILRTPLLHKAVPGYLDKSAEAERRTAVNALTQSYGFLNAMCVQATLEEVRKSIFKYEIISCNEIHDASYWYVKEGKGKNKYAALAFLNKTLIKHMYSVPKELKHPKIKLGGELEVHYPSWNEHHKLPNGASLKIVTKLMKRIKS